MLYGLSLVKTAQRDHRKVFRQALTPYGRLCYHCSVCWGLFSQQPGLKGSAVFILREEINMDTLFLGIITLATVIVIIVLIFVLVELRQTIRKLREFIDTTETSLKPTLDELPHTLRGIRHITENVSVATEDVKTLTASVRQTGENIYRVSSCIEAVTSTSMVHMSGLRAGIKTGVGVLLRSIAPKHKKQIQRR